MDLVLFHHSETEEVLDINNQYTYGRIDINSILPYKKLFFFIKLIKWRDFKMLLGNKKCKHENLQTVTNLYGDAINYFGGRSLKACTSCGKQIIDDSLDKNCKRVNDTKLNKYIMYAKSIGDISDGYHTFDELYYHRMCMFAVICNLFPDKAWKSWKHHDNTMYDDYFIVGITTNQGDYSYHYHKSEWDKFNVKELDRAPEWDGHKPEDITRLFSLIPENIRPRNYILRKQLVVGNRYIINEDMDKFFFLNEADNMEKITIKAGTECTLIKIKGNDIVVIDVDGRLITTESHILDY